MVQPFQLDPNKLTVKSHKQFCSCKKNIFKYNKDASGKSTPKRWDKLCSK